MNRALAFAVLVFALLAGVVIAPAKAQTGPYPGPYPAPAEDQQFQYLTAGWFRPGQGPANGFVLVQSSGGCVYRVAFGLRHWLSCADPGEMNRIWLPFDPDAAPPEATDGARYPVPGDVYELQVGADVVERVTLGGRPIFPRLRLPLVYN